MFSVRLPTGETGPRIFWESQLLNHFNNSERSYKHYSFSIQHMKTEE